MKIKNAARMVLLDDVEKVAIINVGKSEYYKIPGGGVEEERVWLRQWSGRCEKRRDVRRK